MLKWIRSLFVREDSAPASYESDAIRMQVLPVVEGLPHWARVQWAACCGRVAERLCEADLAELDQQFLTRADECMRCAEAAAATAETVSDADALSRELFVLPTGDEQRIKYFAQAAGCICLASANADESSKWSFLTFDFAARIAESLSRTEQVELLRDQLLALNRIAAQRKWTDQTPVPAEELR